jgi:DNA segregation ATPase FtsK/SpoIIIE, S-DNA-T family
LAAAFTPDVVRSIVGTAMMALGAITLIALILPGQGALTDWWRDSIAPWFQTGRWLLPFLLLAGGWYVAAGPGKRPGSGWGTTLIGLGIAYVAALGAFEVLDLDILDLERGGGRIGRFLDEMLAPMLTTPGAFVVLTAVAILGLMLAFNLQLRELFRPVSATARWVGSTASASVRREPADAATGRATTKAPANATRSVGKPVMSTRPADGDPSPVAAPRSILDEPAARSGQAPISRTVWTGETGSQMPLPGGLGATGAPGGVAGAADGSLAAVATGTAALGGAAVAAGVALADPSSDDLADQDGLASIDWQLPTSAELDDRPTKSTGAVVDHASNIRRIEEKLQHFSIPAKVVGSNTGPVVTQYEVRPEKHVKLSRIEALADDLAMALAARSIRIEAPIPGRDVVGIEIPNQTSEMVGFRPFLEEKRMQQAPSPLMFALGRDVSGEAMVVDLAKMPHLLIAGATGSGKSVCVNALITSLLMRARPDEVQMILIDLKRVELAPYNGLPHLLQHVIVEPNEAKAAINWAVHEMEERYKLLAARTVRNIEAYNELPEDRRDERLPYIVVIIDELADLIMREGRKIEDPIVKIAQKARAVGIHLVLATQRPSVNVVTGLIKANVPSRIAFAMASMVDSRTVLDAPGAEDLIGRGDMLYQPVDMPRPARVQGVFVSDAEVSKVTAHWTDQAAGRTFYRADIVEYGDSEGSSNGQFGWLRDFDVDEMTPAAAELVTREGRASTSRLQTKLKLGFARASRVMSELEDRGIVGPQDVRNPASPRIVYGPDNWFRSVDDVDRDD